MPDPDPSVNPFERDFPKPPGTVVISLPLAVSLAVAFPVFERRKTHRQRCRLTPGSLPDHLDHHPLVRQPQVARLPYRPHPSLPEFFQKQNSAAVTSAMLGSFRSDARTRSEFLSLIKGARS